MKLNYQHLKSKLESAWLLQLHNEYYHLINRPNLKKLKPALLRLGAGESYWGQWRAEENSIVISKKLITNYPWNIVKQVLTHEIAHQIVDRFYSLKHKNINPHGDIFKQVCDSLGLAKKYQKASLNLQSNDFSEKESNNQQNLKIIKKVEKILALANSPNLAEAEAAMLKANYLISKYNLNFKKDNPSYQSLVFNTKKQRLSAVNAKLANILAEFFFVEVILSSIYNPLLDIKERTIEIFGQQENIIFAEYAYNFLERSLDKLWIQAKKKGLRSKQSFSLGLLKGFKEKLKTQEEQFQTEPSQSLSLMIINNDHQLQEFIKKKYPYLKKISYQKNKQNHQDHQAGYNLGKKLILNKPLENEKKQTKLFFLT